MACCKPCCGCADCTEGGQGKCCCGGAEGTCCQEGEYCCGGVCQACCDSGDCQEGYDCIGGVCVGTCEDDTGCQACSCCVAGVCEEAVCQEPTPDIDNWSWCGGNLGTGAAGTEALGDICFEGSVTCEDPEATYTFRTRYYFQWSGLIETVECGGTQTTSPGSFPSIPSGNCRFIYRMGGGFGQSSTLADACKARYWWGYVDVDPCEPPASGYLTMVEDTGAAVNGSAISDCESANTPGCRTGCDTDVDDCFSTPPSIPINPAP